MARHLSLVLIACLFVASVTVWCAEPATVIPPAPAPDGTPQVTAQAAMLMDCRTGEVLWERNADQERPMASTTKVMTAMVILDHGADKLDQVVTVSKYAAGTGGSSVLGENYRVTLGDLLRAALVRSSNEATVAAAEFLAGNEDTFIQWMNDKAKELGLQHTHFSDPHGFARKGLPHYSSARDMATIARTALTQPQYALIREIIKMRSLTINADIWDRKTKTLTPGRLGPLENRDRILGQEVPGVPGAIVDGVKTGYINASGHCLISSATRNGWQLVAVVLDSPNTFGDNLALFQYGFTRFQWNSYANPGEPCLQVPVSRGAASVVGVGIDGEAPLCAIARTGAGAPLTLEFRGEALQAPLRRGQVVGAIDLKRDGVTVASAPAVALGDVPLSPQRRFLRGFGYTILGLLALMILGRIYGTVATHSRRRRRQLAARRRNADPAGPCDPER